jgi:hypothetical protein
MISPPRDDRQKRLDPGPQVVRDDPRWLPFRTASLNHHIMTGVAVRQSALNTGGLA